MHPTSGLILTSLVLGVASVITGVGTEVINGSDVLIAMPFRNHCTSAISHIEFDKGCGGSWKYRFYGWWAINGLHYMCLRSG